MAQDNPIWRFSIAPVVLAASARQTRRSEPEVDGLTA